MIKSKGRIMSKRYHALIAPVYELGRTSIGATTLAHGAIREHGGLPVTVPLKAEHMPDITIGTASITREDTTGYHGYIDIYDSGVSLIEERGMYGLSIGGKLGSHYLAADGITTVVSQVEVSEVSLVRRPAFATARIINK